VIFSDNEEALVNSNFFFFNSNLLAIKATFSKSQHNYCAWHIQQNFKKSLLFLIGWKRKIRLMIVLYQTIIHLPYQILLITLRMITILLKGTYINNSLKDYMNEKYQRAKNWAKCYYGMLVIRFGTPLISLWRLGIHKQIWYHFRALSKISSNLGSDLYFKEASLCYIKKMGFLFKFFSRLFHDIYYTTIRYLYNYIKLCWAFRALSD